MKKNSVGVFLAKFFLFVGFVWIVDFAVGSIFVSLKNRGLELNPENMWLKSSFVAEKVNKDVLIIGSSRASHHYIPLLFEDSLSLSTYNCGQDGCFFLYQNCMVNMVLDRYCPRLIVWDIQPGSFIDSYLNQEYQNFRYLSPYYSSSKWVKSYVDSESEKMKYRMLSSMFAYNSKVLNFLFPLVVRSSSTTQGYIPLANAGYSFPVMNGQSDETPYFVRQDYLELLSETLQRCYEKGVLVKLFVSPEYVPASRSYEEVVQDIKQVACTHDSECCDYSSAPLFLQDASLFKDAFHLNDKGARTYTQMVIAEIKNCFSN